MHSQPPTDNYDAAVIATEPKKNRITRENIMNFYTLSSHNNNNNNYVVLRKHRKSTNIEIGK